MYVQSSMYNSYMDKLRNYETKHESKGYISPGTLRNGKVFETAKESKGYISPGTLRNDKVFETAKCVSMYTPLTSC